MRTLKSRLQKPRRKRRTGVLVQFNLERFCRSLEMCLRTPFDGPGQLVERQVSWEDERAFAISYLFSEMLSKYDDGKPSPEREATTWQRFVEAERSCFEINQVLAVSGFQNQHQSVIERTREIIAKILGDFSWDECEPFMGWGPGATTRLRRREAAAAYKFSGKPETTAGNAILGYTAICRVPAWETMLRLREQGLDGLQIVPGNRIITVPKNYRTDRTIAIEPDLNMYIQKGIGGVIRRKLRRWGCDLDDQTRNQRMAALAVTEGLATVDLKMASDTISREVVSQLLPPDWLLALEQCRSPFGVLPSGEKIFYQKFSSMGNGFTFELESLIFLALCRAVAEACGEKGHRVSVYGDDLIVPASCYELLCGALRSLGFTPNEKKSYADGPFRESCGKHYFSGHDVTPFYVRRPVTSLDRLFLLHNQLWRWAERTRLVIGEESYEALQLELRRLRALAPATWRKPRLPDGFGDGAFIGFVDQLSLTPHKWGWEYWQVSALERTSSELEGPAGTVLASLSLLEKRGSDKSAWLSSRGSLQYDVSRLRLLDEQSEVSGAPSEVRGYREMKILIPRFPPA